MFRFCKFGQKHQGTTMKNQVPSVLCQIAALLSCVRTASGQYSAPNLGNAAYNYGAVCKQQPCGPIPRASNTKPQSRNNYEDLFFLLPSPFSRKFPRKISNRRPYRRMKMRKKPVHGDFEAFSSRWPKYAARVMVILCLALYRPVSLPASPLDSWSNRASGISSQLSDIAYGGTRFVAVGDGGKILTSEDGITWTMRDSGTSDGLSGVAYAGGLFVIGVNSWVSPGFLLISQDGVSWTRSNSGVNGALSGLAYGNGNFVAVGGRGNITSSPDGTNWTQRSSGTGNFLFEVAYGKGLFVAVGGYGSSATILTSQDGATWAAQTAGLSEVLNGVTFGDGLFAAVGSSGDVATSSDGTNWT